MIVCVGLVAVSVGLLAGYRWMTTLNYFSIKDVQVAGLNLMTREDLLRNLPGEPSLKGAANRLANEYLEGKE